MSSIINSMKCCFKDSGVISDKEAQISHLLSLKNQPTGYTVNTSYTNEQKPKTRMNLDQGEKHYSFQVSENMFSCLAQSKQNELNHINSFNSENLYAQTRNLKEIKDSPTELVSSKGTEDKAFLMNNAVILDKDIAENKRLQVSDYEGGLLKGITIKINAGGMEEGKRQMRDGKTFFGTVLKNDNCVINDCIVNHPTTCVSRLFVIFFELKSRTYFIRFLNENGNTDDINNRLFMQIDKPFVLPKKSYFCVGVALICIEQTNESVTISFLDSDNKKEFTFNKNSTAAFTIGKKKSCDVHLQLPLVSKVHCTISYDEEQKAWVIYDGYKNKKSTNGLWYLIRKKYPIQKDVSFFKIGSSVIKILTLDE